MLKASCFCIITWLFTGLLTAQTLSIITERSHSREGCVQLENPPTQYDKKQLQVFLLPQNPDSPVSPIVGSWFEDSTSIYFCPLIPFGKDLIYQARFPDVPFFTFTPTPQKNYPLTTITNIFPTKAELPENLLKIYLHFSAPMSDVNAYQYLQMTDEQGNSMKQPFLELTPMLWNENRTRLTLWLDPGRVKRALLRHQKLGAPLIEGKNYSLHISRDWKDANGYPLANNFTKEIKVVAADRTAPNPERWTIEPPKVQTKNPLLIHFGESLDHALATKAIEIVSQENEVMEGAIQLHKFDQTWVFRPTRKWQRGKYQIKIDSKLEDLAGNNLNRLFDTNLSELTESSDDSPYYFLTFQVR
ncbi:MAG: hypothetical protein AAF960_09665 [Bacteroidota bacterium]